MVLRVRGDIEGSWRPIVRLHGRKTQPRQPNTRLATRALRIGSASNLAAFERGRVWPTLLQTIAQKARFVEHLLLLFGGGWGCGIGVWDLAFFFWCQDGGGGLGPPPTTRHQFYF